MEPRPKIYTYDSNFFDYIEMGAQRSARVVTRLLLAHLPIKSVLDVGCGRGVWLDEWAKQGGVEILGVDGSYVEPDRLVVPTHAFRSANLAEPLDLDRRFGLVQSLEVAEHIPEQAADVFVQNLIAHGDRVLFSAAPPGQGGEFHVNEQSYDYWRDKFAQHGYCLIDFVRPEILNQSAVEPWYRYNTLLFVRSQTIETLPAHLRASISDPHKPVKDYAPLTWRIRRAVLSRLPGPVVAWMVKIKHSIVLTLHRFKTRRSSTLA
ncbi:MAG: methyltransferase domain-containing protein [Cyanobacteria bacterium J06635_15]